MADIGQLALSLAFVASAAGVFAGLRALLRGTNSYLATTMVHLTFAACTVAAAALLIALLGHDYRIKYVYEHIDNALPTVYVVAALWGGQSGSLLLWTFLLAAFSSFAIWRLRRTSPQAALPATVLMLFLTCFFISLVVYVTDPFARFGLEFADGRGLNPQLRTVEMLFHPPTLYFGYVGFAVPFAIFLGGLWAKRLDAALFRSIRAWTLFSWGMLTIGIVLGAEWAYIELGWGGFWAWDPVENASLLPWLTGTAAIHSLVLTRRRSMLKITSFILVALTFALCVFGTLLTRSGIIASVHAFGKSPLLYFFLGLIAVTVVLTVKTIAARTEFLRSKNRLQSFLSREGMFIGCIVVLLAATAVVFWGTMLPVFSRLVTGSEMTWDVLTYNLTSFPFALALLAVMGMGMFFEQRLEGAARFLLAIPALLAGLVGAVVIHTAFRTSADHQAFFERILFGYAPPLIIGVAVMAGAVVLASIAWQTYKNQRLPSGRRLGAYVVHLGVVAMFLGMAGSGYVVSNEVTLEPGESAKIGRYEVTFNGLDHIQPPDAYHETVADLTYTDGEQDYGKLSPSMVFFKKDSKPHSEVGVRPGLKQDLYSILSAYDGNTASFKLLLNPLITWLWIGSLMLVLGVLAAAIPRRRTGAGIKEAQSQPPAARPASFCPSCGEKIDHAGARFCPHCGTNIKEHPVEA